MSYQAFNQNQRRMCRVAERQGNWKCHYCECPLIPVGQAAEPGHRRPTLDHRKPRSKNGSSVTKNLVLCCADCNTEKGSQSYKDYMSLWDKRKGGNP